MKTLLHSHTKHSVLFVFVLGVFFIPGLFTQASATESCGYVGPIYPTVSPNYPPTCSLSADKTTIEPGEKVTLTWTSSPSSVIDYAWFNNGICNVPTSGSKSVYPTETTTYILKVFNNELNKGQYGLGSCQVTITVDDAPICLAPAPRAEISYTGDTFVGGYSSWEWSWESKKNHSAQWRKYGCDNGSNSSWSAWNPVGGLDKGSDGPWLLDASHAGCTYEIKYSVTNTCGVTDTDLAHMTIASIEEPELPTCDAFTITPSSRTGAGYVKFAWNTTDATSVSINNGVGTVPADGSKDVWVTQTKTYTLTASNSDGSDMCTATVTVVPETPERYCELYAQDTTITRGESTRLTWYTNFPYTDWLSINQGVGIVSRYGYKDVSPTDTTTYILTVSGRESPYGFSTLVTCDKTITVIPVSEPELPSCDAFSASPTSLVGAGNVILSWNTTDATSVAIDQGVGTVPVDGWKSVYVEDDTIFTLTASNTDGTDTCTTQVTVTPPEPEAPSCDAFTITPSSRVGAGYVTFAWETTNATDVSIDNGVGSVPVDGSKEVWVTESGTYVLTASKEGESDTCTYSVTVTPPVVEAPTCDAFTASPSSRTGAGDITLSWNTTDADSVSIDHSIGSVEADGTKVVRVTADTTFVLTATNEAGSVTCDTTVTILPVIPDAPTCDAFTASPSSRTGSGDITLSWNTTNADSVSIDEGIGSVTDDGSKTVRVTSDTTFTLTATNESGSVTCDTTVTILPVIPDAPTCDAFTASPSSRTGAGDITLSWNTTNADSVSINQGIGTVAEDGTKVVTVSADTTFTLTATNESGSVTCDTFVDIRSSGGGGGSSSPRCDLEASDTKISKGDSVTLSWKNKYTNDILLEDNFGKTLVDTEDGDKFDEDEDDIKVSPTKTTTYTLTAIRGSKDDDCKVKITVTDGEVAGISFTGTRYQDLISLATTPYTGFEAGTVLTFLFYLAIGLWSAVIAYALLLKKRVVSGVSATKNTVYSTAPVFEAPTVAEPMVDESVPFNIPTDFDESEMVVGEEDTVRALEEYAHANYTLISSDALKYIESQGASSEAQISVLDNIISEARAKYPKEGDWIILNKERVLSLLS